MMDVTEPPSSGGRNGKRGARPIASPQGQLTASDRLMRGISRFANAANNRRFPRCGLIQESARNRAEVREALGWIVNRRRSSWRCNRRNRSLPERSATWDDCLDITRGDPRG